MEFLLNPRMGYFGIKNIGGVLFPGVYFRATLFFVPAFVFYLFPPIEFEFGNKDGINYYSIRKILKITLKVIIGLIIIPLIINILAVIVVKFM